MGFGERSATGDSVGCRFCGAPLELTVVDLGMSPLCESFVPADRLERMEPFYPLHVRACYALLARAAARVRPPGGDLHGVRVLLRLLDRVGRACASVRRDDPASGWSSAQTDLVVELASNDGYLLQHFVGTGVPILGIDPAANVAAAAEERGVPTLVEFFGRETARAAR